MVAVYKMLPFVALTLATPVLVDPEINPNEISVYFDREKWCFTVVGVVNMIELSEQLADGQTSISLYGNITRGLDIQDLMTEIVLNTTDTELSSLEKIEAKYSADGWGIPNRKTKRFHRKMVSEPADSLPGNIQ